MSEEQKNDNKEADRKKQEDKKTVQTDRIPKENGHYVLLSIKGVLMIAAIALICSSNDISVANPCDLQTALKSLHLSFTPSCKYDAIKKKTSDLHIQGLAALCCHGILSIFILCIYLWPSENKQIGFLIIYVVVLIVAVIFSVLTYIQKVGLDDARRTKTNVDYVRIQRDMLFSLEKYFTTDNISSSDETSSYWNTFFIKYDCCAVREVQGTTNDFDNTPWCTTSGSCQNTASQIPKTCCKDVTQDDYQYAPDICHASVNPGTYRTSCIGRVKSLSVRNIDVCQVCMLSFSLLSLVILQIFEAIVAIVMIIFITWDFIRFKIQSTRKNKTDPGQGDCDKTMLHSNRSYENEDNVAK
ncbi:uncharacterized protein LOC111124642 [Crassostrea virginica]